MDSPLDPTVTRPEGPRDLLFVHPDDPYGRALQCHLEDRGFRVVRAVDAVAQRALGDLAPRLVVVDLDARDRDGFLLLDLMANRPKRPPVLVLGRSADVESISPDVRRTLGIDVAVSRPIRFATLTVLLESLFDQRWSTPARTNEEARCRAA